MSISMESNLAELERWIAISIARLSPAEQKKVFREIGRELRRENARRMGTQLSPEGEPWQARRTHEASTGGSGRPRGRRNANPQRGNPELRFRYDGNPVHLKSYEDEGNTLLGFDLITRSIKRYRKDRINKRASRPKRMMRKLRQTKHLRQRFMADGVRVGFFGRDGYLASVHHYGKYQQLRYGIAQYPRRELLGINEADQAMIRESLLRHLHMITNP